MKHCDNCGARINSNTRICPNCGAACNDGEDYFVITTQDKPKQEPVKAKTNSGKSTVIVVLLAIAVIAAAAFGTYYYMENYYFKEDTQPKLTFSAGTGLINDDEPVVYVDLPDDSNVELIHGVTLYDYDITDKNAQSKEPVTTNYEYTKSIDETFRTIFFYLDDIEPAVADGENYTFTFQMNFSFVNDPTVYNYTQTVNFTAGDYKDVSDIIFDHTDSRIETLPAGETTTVKETTTKKETTSQSTTQNVVNAEYIYNSFWYTEPENNGNEYTIYAVKFNKSGDFISTKYYKKGQSNWQTSTFEGTFEISGDQIIMDNGAGSEQSFYQLDSDAETLKQINNGEASQELTKRKYNSIKNAEDFFGL